MRLTGLSEFLWFLLIFGALFAFTVWRQQRDRRRREERMAAMSAPVEAEPGPVSTRPGPEAAPDISWGRGPAAAVPPPELPPDWSEVPASVQPPELPVRATPTPTRAPRRATPAPAPAAVARRGAMQFRSAAGLRQAVIALTVLGPCRALEPYGGQAPDGGGAVRPPRER